MGESFNCFSNTTVAYTALVPSSTPVVHSQSTSNPLVIRFVTQPSREAPPSFSHSKQLVSSGMESFRSNFVSKEFQSTLPVLSKNLEEKELGQIMTRPGQSGLAGVTNNKLMTALN